MSDARIFPHFESHLRYEGEDGVSIPFDDRNPFGSVLFWLSGATVGEMVTAIERVGFVTWDPFGRYLRIPPMSEGAQEHEWLRDRLKEELERYRECELQALKEGREFESDPAEYPRCRLSGWTADDVPDFWDLGVQWNIEQSGGPSVPAAPATALVIDAPDRMDDWCKCIVHAFEKFRKQYGADPEASQLWSYLSSGQLRGWHISSTARGRRVELTLGEKTLDRECFGKRFKKYFKEKVNNRE